MPAFEIAWSRPARRTLARPPAKIPTAAVEFIYGALATNPHRVGKPLRLELGGLHSARRGDYRLIYHTDGPRQQVEIVAIEHRADVYRPGRQRHTP